jgi:hypothetical protein
MPLVKLRDDIKGTFRRSQRDKTGAILKTLEFPSGLPVDVDWNDLSVIANDLHNALVPVVPLFYPAKTSDPNEALVPNGKYRTIPKDVLEAMLNAPPEPDDAELEALTAPEPVSVDVSDLPMSPQMAEAVKPPETGVTSGAKPARRSR